MRPLRTAETVDYGVLDYEDVAEMTSLLAEVFSRYDPPALAVGLSSQEVQALVSLFGPRAVAEGLTVVAREHDTGALVGAMLTEDFATVPPPGIGVAAPAFGPIGSLLATLEARYKAARRVQEGEFLHLFMLGVNPRCGGRGLAQGLVTATLANGRMRGYRHAVTEATGRVSQHVFRKLGFREVLMERYQDFVFKGRRVFAPITEHEGTILMDAECGEGDAT